MFIYQELMKRYEMALSYIVMYYHEVSEFKYFV